MLQIRSLPVLCSSQGPPKNKPNVQNLPPGPPMLPFIGNLHELLGPRPLNHTLTHLAKQYGPIMHMKFGEISTIVISSPEVAEEVLKTHDLTFAQRPQVYVTESVGYNHSGIVTCPYGNRFKKLRKITTLELLSSKRVRSFRSLREEEVWSLVHSISSSSKWGRSINLTEKVFSLSSSIILRSAFGKNCKHAKEFASVAKQWNELSGRLHIRDVFPSFTFLPFVDWITKPTMEKLRKETDKIVDNIINEHKPARAIGDHDTTRDEDLVDVLLKLHKSNDLEFHVTIETIKALISEIFIAGTDTSASTIEWAMAEMLKNPEVMIKAQAEVRQGLKGKTSKITEEDIQGLSYLKLVINETLRLHPTITLLPRESTESCELSGYTIPEKSKVFINLQAIGRDPNFWDDPDCFKPERFNASPIKYNGSNFEYIPFGAGRRICPGISFALATIELALALLLYHFDWKLPNGMKPEELDMTEVYSAILKRKNDLRVTATLVSET